MRLNYTDNLRKIRIYSIGKKLFFMAFLFYPLQLYRWRIYGLPSVSVYEILLLSSSFLMLLSFNIKLKKIFFPLMLLMGLYIFEIFIFIIYNQKFIYIIYEFLVGEVIWVLVFILSGQFLTEKIDFKKIFKAISFSSIWVLGGILLHFYEILSGRLFRGVPFSEVLHITKPLLQETQELLFNVTTYYGLRRFSFPFSQSSSAAGIDAAIIFIVTLGYYIYIERRKKSYLYLALIDLIYVIFTFSRTAWIVTTIGVILIIFDKKNVEIKRITIFLVMFLGFIIMLMFILSIIQAKTGIDVYLLLKGRIFNEGATKISTEGHLETRMYALKIFINHVFTGNGLGGYYYSRVINNVDHGPHPHSNYFLVMAEGGLIGLFIYFILLFEPLYKNLKKKNKSNFIKIIIFLQISLYIGMIFYTYFTGYLPLIIISSWILKNSK